MKRCPECRRDYHDDSLLYCLEDGNLLLQGAVSSPDEPETAMMNESVLPLGESTTRAQIHTTEQTAVLPSGAAGGFSNSTQKTGFDKRWLIVPLLLAVSAAGGFFAFRYFSSTGSGQINSIAVLPFENRSGNADNEYLSDGLAESLIYRLSQIPDLKVSPTSSVFRYKGKESDPQVVARELGVDSVMTGRITQRGDNLTISVNLVDTRSGKSLWGEQYERKLSELLATQREIAAEITNKLQLKLSGAGEQKLTKSYTTNNEAYQLYLKGRFHWNKRTAESLRQAVEFYNQAIGKDPNFALAYSGLAETYALFSSYSVATARDSMPQAKAAAERALSLDESLAEAHSALGTYLNYYEWDRAGSERAYRRAIELNPNYATAHQWLGADNLVLRKRFDEALAALRRAEELDPLSPIISMNVGLSLMFARRYDEAIAQLNRTLTLDPNFTYAHIVLGWTFASKGMYREAIAAYRKGLDLAYDPVNKGFLALLLARTGQRAEAAQMLAELKQEATQRYVPSYAMALACLGLDEKEVAFVWLEKQVEERGYFASVYAVAPELDELRGDPRFKEMLKRLNLPE